ncbi:MAG: hypothetical protein WBD30_04735, partial [Bacteroidota bacterium]
MKIRSLLLLAGVIASVLPTRVTYCTGEGGKEMESVIPKPVSLERHRGRFKIDWRTQVFVSPPEQEVLGVARFL